MNYDSSWNSNRAQLRKLFDMLDLHRKMHGKDSDAVKKVQQKIKEMGNSCTKADLAILMVDPCPLIRKWAKLVSKRYLKK